MINNLRRCVKWNQRKEFLGKFSNLQRGFTRWRGKVFTSRRYGREWRTWLVLKKENTLDMGRRFLNERQAGKYTFDMRERRLLNDVSLEICF